MSKRYLTGDPVRDNMYYRWYAGNHCFPKCTPRKCHQCEAKIRTLFASELPKSHKQFVFLIRRKCPICDLPESSYRRNIYREPLHMERTLHE